MFVNTGMSGVSFNGWTVRRIATVSRIRWTVHSSRALAERRG
jgi:hypothetical protein